MEINMDEVREYLLETNSIEEAETIILHNILKKSNESLQKKIIKDALHQSTTDTSTAKENADKLDNLKISDLLGSLEEEYKASSQQRNQTSPLPALAESHAEKQAKELEKLKLFENVAEQELAELEKKRDWMQLKKLANKYELDKLNVIIKPEETPAQARKSAAREAPIPFPKNSKETMNKLYELTEEHARKVAENRAETLAYRRELEQLNQGNWSLHNSYLTNKVNYSKQQVPDMVVMSSSALRPRTPEEVDPSPSDAPLPAGASAVSERRPSAVVDTGEGRTNSTTPPHSYPNQNRIHEILRSVSSDEAVQAQKREIESLRQLASVSDQSLRSDPVLHNMEKLIKNTRKVNEIVGRGEADTNMHVVDRNMSVGEYLNKWLSVPQKEKPQPDHKQGSSEASTKPVAPSEPIRSQLRQPSRVLTQSGLNGLQNNSSETVDPTTAPSHTNAATHSVSIGSGEKYGESRDSGGDNQKHSNSGDAVQELIEKLKEETRQLQEEKLSMWRKKDSMKQRDQERATDNHQDHNFLGKSAITHSPERPAGMRGGWGGGLDQFRSHAQQYPPQYQYQHQHSPHAPYSGMPPGVSPPYYPSHPQQQQQQQHPYMGHLGQHAQYQPPPQHQHMMGNPYGMGMGMGMGGVPSAVDPQQAAALAQLQQMAEQMERENNKLLSQLGVAPTGEQPRNDPFPYGLGINEVNSGEAGQPLNPGEPRRNLDNSHLFTLERDKNRNIPKPSRSELRHQEEVRKIQQEIEKIKYQSELDIVQAEYEQSRARRLKELEHERWLQQQKQDLQALKIQQVLAKEQRMLRLHQEDRGGGGATGEGGGGGDAGAGGASRKNPAQAEDNNPAVRSSSAIARDHALEDCGVGTSPMPLDLASGITIIVDGIILPRSLQTGMQFRIALGLFDKAGKALVRLTASQWQPWSQSTSNDQQEGAVQHVKELLTRTLKISESKVDLGNARVLLELQTKDTMNGGQVGVGWAVMPVVKSAIGSDDQAINTIESKDNVLLCNNAWRAVLRKSLSDPSIPDLFAPPESAIFEAWFLVRILDSNAKQQASAWTLNGSVFHSEQQLLRLYKDVMEARKQESAVVMSSKKVLDQDPDMRSLFSRDGRSPIGFSAQSSVADLLGSPDKNNNGMNKPGAMAALKAVGMFKSRSKAKLGLPNITEETSSRGAVASPLGAMSRKPSTALPSGKAFVPPGSSQRGATPASPAMAGFGAMARKAPTPGADGAEDGNGEDKAKELLRAADDKTYWYLGKPLGPCNDKYQKGDGIDVYIDSAMFLPDNCTLSRVTMRLFTSDKEQIGSVYECYSLANSPSISPVFKFKVELRLGSFNATVTALLRIDTIDAATLLPASVGYCCFKLFASRDRVQPRIATELNACVNTGNFQIPIHAGRIPTSLTAMNDQMLNTLPKIPAASLLVRILPAPKSADGISTLSKDEFPSSDWSRLGLDVPAPTYASGEYSGTLCEPTDIEMVCYRAKSQNPTESVESALLQAITAHPTEAIGLPQKPPTGAGDVDAVQAWIKQLLPSHDQMRRSIEYTYAVPYSVETGLVVSVDRLHNMPEPGIFTSHSTLYKVITSTSPPGLFYKDPPLYDGVYYTKTQNLETHMRAPEFTDGFYDFTPSTLNGNLYLVLDVRTLKVEAKKSTEEPKITLEPPSQKKQYWTLLPLCIEKIPGQGYKYVSSGVYHLPLIEGAVPAEEVFRATNPYKEICSRLSAKGKSITNLKVMDGGMVAVRVMNPLLKDLVQPEMDSAKPNIHTEFMEDLLLHAISGSSGSNARADKFTVDAAKLQVGGTNGGKSTAAQLPKGCLADLPAFMRTVNKEFETATGLASR